MDKVVRSHKPRSGERIFLRYAARSRTNVLTTACGRGYILPPLPRLVSQVCYYLKGSLRTSVGLLSSRKPTKRECRKWSSGVHSVNSNWPTKAGFNHRQSFIFSVVSPCPHRPLSCLREIRERAFGDFQTAKTASTALLAVKPLRVRDTYSSFEPS